MPTMPSSLTAEGSAAAAAAAVGIALNSSASPASTNSFPRSPMAEPWCGERRTSNGSHRKASPHRKSRRCWPLDVENEEGEGAAADAAPCSGEASGSGGDSTGGLEERSNHCIERSLSKSKRWRRPLFLPPPAKAFQPIPSTALLRLLRVLWARTSVALLVLTVVVFLQTLLA